MGLSSLRFLTVVRLTCARERSTIEPLASRIVDRISVNPNVHFGKPCVAGTRITVENVLELVSEGLSFEEIIRDYYPELTVQDIQACLRYAKALVAAEDIDLKPVHA